MSAKALIYEVSNDFPTMGNHYFKTNFENTVLGISDRPGPDFLTTKGLQKGLIVYHNDNPVVQEGLGFGAPIIRTATATYFSKNAHLEIKGNSIIKRYKLDCVSKINFGNKTIDNRLFSVLFESLVCLYMKSEALQPFLLRGQRLLAKLFDASCSFWSVPSIGTAEILYSLSNNSINLKSKFSTDLKGVKYIIANEQGADYFDNAIVDNRKLNDEQIKGWVNAQRATLHSGLVNLSFSIVSPKSAKMYLGRERTPYLCWSGINIESDLPTIDLEIRLGK